MMLLLAGCGGTPGPAKTDPVPPTTVATTSPSAGPSTAPAGTATVDPTQTIDTSLATQLARFRGTWELVDVEGLHPDTKTAGVTLQIEPAAVSGFVGCSQFASKAVLSGIQLEVTDWTSQELNPCYRGNEEVETGLAAFLDENPHLEPQGEDHIVITGPDGKLVFVRAGTRTETGTETGPATGTNG